MSDNSKKAVEILSSYRAKVWPEVEKYLHDPVYPERFKTPQEFKDSEDKFWEITKDYPERGSKYLRPTLLVLAAEAMGIDTDSALPAAAAMQLSEEWMLIHDDFEDDSPKRRGKPALHKLYGDSQAVNSGDGLHAMMWKIIYDNFSDSPEVANEFYKIIMRTILGQSAEIALIEEPLREFTDEEWYFIADGKSSYYSITGPLRLGAIIAGANDEQLDKITEFGFNLGRCFQLVDDILDVTSDFGGRKEFANDIYEGKKTLLLAHLLRTAEGEDKVKVIEILKKPREEKTEEEVQLVLDAMHKYGTIDYAKGIAADYKDKALAIFDNDLDFLSEEPARSNLRSLTQFILERDH